MAYRVKTRNRWLCSPGLKFSVNEHSESGRFKRAVAWTAEKEVADAIACALNSVAKDKAQRKAPAKRAPKAKRKAELAIA